MPRYVILAIRSFDYIESKTGNMLLRYKPDCVFAIIDPQNEGKIAEEVIGWGGSIPCVSNFKDSMIYKPTHLVIGNAPQGGLIDKITLNSNLIWLFFLEALLIDSNKYNAGITLLS